MDPKEYKEALDKAVRLAHEKRNYLSHADFDRFFKALSLTEEQEKLTREYLSGLHIAFGDKEEKEEGLNDEEPLMPEDGNYLSLYLEGLKELPEYTEEEEALIYERAMNGNDEEARELLINLHLKNVVDIARLYVYHGMRLEDLIGEGNIGLMMAVDLLGTADTKEEAEGLIGKTIMDAMDAAIKEDRALKDDIDAMLDNINKIAEAAKELSDDMRRDLSISELAENSDFTEAEIEKAFEFTGFAIPGIAKPL